MYVFVNVYVTASATKKQSSSVFIPRGKYEKERQLSDSTQVRV